MCVTEHAGLEPRFRSNHTKTRQMRHYKKGCLKSRTPRRPQGPAVVGVLASCGACGSAPQELEALNLGGVERGTAGREEDSGLADDEALEGDTAVADVRDRVELEAGSVIARGVIHPARGKRREAAGRRGNRLLSCASTPPMYTIPAAFCKARTADFRCASGKCRCSNTENSPWRRRRTQ